MEDIKKTIPFKKEIIQIKIFNNMLDKIIMMKSKDQRLEGLKHLSVYTKKLKLYD